MDPFLKKKWERVFYTFFDTDKNGVIEWKDFELLFDKIKILRGSESREYKIVNDTFQVVWQGLLHATKGTGLFSDIDYSQKITVDEWNQFWSTYNPKHMDIWLWEYLKFTFFLIDLSGDKLVDESEYVDAMKLYGFDRESSMKAFEKFALNDKGQAIEAIDYGQFVKLWIEYFCSKDKNSPGSYLFGMW